MGGVVISLPVKVIKMVWSKLAVRVCLCARVFMCMHM